MVLLCCIYFTHAIRNTTQSNPKASLFRVFQQVFDAPRDARYEEIRRLGVYIMRAFIEVAKTNPKVYAELFFYKSIREANDIEYGYDDQRYANGYKNLMQTTFQIDFCEYAHTHIYIHIYKSILCISLPYLFSCGQNGNGISFFSRSPSSPSWSCSFLPLRAAIQCWK